MNYYIICNNKVIDSCKTLKQATKIVAKLSATHVGAKYIIAENVAELGWPPRENKK